MSYPIRPFTEGMIRVPIPAAQRAAQAAAEARDCIATARQMQALQGPRSYVSALARRARRLARLARALLREAA